MSESITYTPGPWHCDDHGYIYDKNETPIGQLFDNPDDGTGRIDHEQSDYNMALVAAAPLLLEALEGLLAAENDSIEQFEAAQIDRLQSAMIKADAAIQKAKGGV